MITFDRNTQVEHHATVPTIAADIVAPLPAASGELVHLYVVAAMHYGSTPLTDAEAEALAAALLMLAA